MRARLITPNYPESRCTNIHPRPEPPWLFSLPDAPSLLQVPVLCDAVSALPCTALRKSVFVFPRLPLDIPVGVLGLIEQVNHVHQVSVEKSGKWPPHLHCQIDLSLIGSFVFQYCSLHDHSFLK